MTSRALVVGAGLSGLNAARTLQAAGWQVRVLEAGGRPGGRASTEIRDGFVIDTGPDAMTTAYTEYLRLADELGISDRVVPSSPVVGIVRGGRLFDVDTTSVRAAFTSALSMGAKLRLARGVFAMRREIAQADAFNLVAQAADDDPGTSAYDFSLKTFGLEATEYLIDPLVRLVTGTGSRNATVLSVRAVLSAWSSPMLNIVGGIALLPVKLGEAIDIAYGMTVDRVEQDGTGLDATFRTGDGQTRQERFDAAVIATQIDAAVSISPYLEGLIGELAPRIGRLSLMSIALAFERPTQSRAYAVQIPTVEHPDELLMFLQHNKAPDRAPPGKSLISYYIDHRSAERYFAMSDDEVTRRAVAFVSGLMPELAESFLFSHITRWKRAGSLADPGYYRTVQEIRRRIPAMGAIQLAGDFYSAGSMETALRSGAAAAERIIARHARGGGARDPERNERPLRAAIAGLADK